MNINLTPKEYLDHEYNGTLTNERCIEIPLAKRYAEEIGYDNIIEIGAVLPYYGQDKHEIYDPFDTHPASKKEFAENLDIKDKNILSVSTLEHMGEAQGYGRWYRCKEPNKSYDFINKLSQEAKSFLITLPVNQHLDLDKSLKANISNFQWFGYVKDIQTPPMWRLSLDVEEVLSKKYAEPFNCANGVMFLYKGITCS